MEVTLHTLGVFAGALLGACRAGLVPDAAPAPAATPADAPRPSARPVSPPAPPTVTRWQPRDDDRVEPHQPLANSAALATFYDALARIDAPGGRGIVRVVHLGASMIGHDDLTSILRVKFQRRFGDGGAGLVMLQRYVDNYEHRAVRLRGRGWDDCSLFFLCARDGHYGLGGVSFSSTGGARTSIATLEQDPGGSVAHIELWYAAIPSGGSLQLRVDKGEAHRVGARAHALEDRYHELEVPAGPHSVEIRARGRARAYGVVLETNGPGVVWDQFSMLGVLTPRLLKIDAEHLAGQMEHRDPDLIVFSFGGNDTRRVKRGRIDSAGYAAELEAALRHVRAGKPDAPCLVLATTDRRRSLGHDILPEHVEAIVNAQRAVAIAEGCALFDTYSAMGGERAFDRWAAQTPPLASRDQIHLTHAGHERIGGWIYDALIGGYVAHREDEGT